MKRILVIALMGVGVMAPFPRRADAQWMRVRGDMPFVSCLLAHGTGLLAAGRRTASPFGGIVLESRDNGKSWKPLNGNGWPDGGYGGQQAVGCLTVSGTYLLAGTDGRGVLGSADGGVSWTELNLGWPHLSVWCLAVSGSNVYAADTEHGIFVSRDNGTSWAQANTGLPKGLSVDALAVSGPNVLAAVSCKGVFLSGDNGTSWTPANAGLPAIACVYRFAISGTYVLAPAGDGLYRSADDGASWTKALELPKKSGVLCFAVSGPNVYIGTLGAGVFQSKDNGRTWVAINLGLAPTLIEVQSLAVTDTLLIAAITKREQTDYSIWRMPLAAWPTSDQPMVQDYMENGDGAFQVGDFANAVFFYGKVLERDANSVQARLQRARSGLKIGDRSSLETALADVNKVLGSSPGQKDVYLVRGDIYLRLAGLASETTATKQAGDFADMAISDYQKALEASPNSREIALRIGDARLAKGDLEGALAEYGKLLEKDPNDWDRMITPHLDRAFEAYDKLGRDCDCGSYKDTWYLAGKFQDRKHQYDRAIKCYSRAIELGLTDFSAYWSRAVDYNFIGELDKALSDANATMKFNQYRSYVYKLRADIYQQKGELDKAIVDYHAALKALLGEVKKTVPSEEAEQAVDKEAYEIHLGTAEAYLKKQNWSKAIDEYQAAIEFTVNPGQRRAFVLYRIGLAYQKKGDAANAQKYIQQAEAMDPKLKK